MGRRKKIKSIDCTFRATIVQRGRRTRIAVPILPQGWSVEETIPTVAPVVVDTSPVPSPGGCEEPLDRGASEERCNVQGPTYAERQERLAESWSAIREDLRRVAVTACSLPVGQICCVHGCGELASMRCIDCGSTEYLCVRCAEVLHARRCVFHRLEMWKVSLAWSTLRIVLVIVK